MAALPKPTLGVNSDYAARIGALFDVVEGPARRNFIRNGDFDVAQRGTSLAGLTAAVYTLDGWVNGAAGTTTVSQQSFAVGQTNVPGNPRKFLRMERTGAAGADNNVIEHRIEFPERLSGKTVTVSFYARVAAGTKALVFDCGSSGVTPAINTDDNSFTATTSWALVKATITLPAMTAATAAAYLSLRVREAAGFGTFTLDIADVQLELGDAATEFDRLGYDEQWRWNGRFFLQVGNSAIIASGGYYSNILFMAALQLPAMRAGPTVTVSAVSDIKVDSNGGLFTASEVSLTFASGLMARLDITTAAATAGHCGTAHIVAGPTWLRFSAEL